MADNVMESKIDVFGEIFSRLPLNCVVQCKLLNQNFRSMISNSEFAQLLLQRHKNTSTQLIYTEYDGGARRRFNKFSLNPITQLESSIPDYMDILASCNGLILIDFELVSRYCVFNPVTGEHQLIPYPMPYPNGIGKIGLAVDYPNPDQYKLVTVSSFFENSYRLYKFHLLSSEQPGLWREIQLRTNNVQSLAYGSRAVYWRGSLYFLRTDGSVLAFDTNKEEAILIDRPEFLDNFDLTYGKILIGQSKWLGKAQGLLTLVCVYRMHIVIATYGSTKRRWTVSHKFANFILGPQGFIHGFPLWIENKHVSFLVQRPLTLNYDLYEHNININGYEHAAVLHGVNSLMYYFHPTLASAHHTPSDDIDADDQELIDANLDDIRRFIIEDIPFPEESSSESSSSSSSEGEEEEGEEEEAAAAAEGGEEEIV
ncbi:putative F-box/kelch-repeat protein At1g20790 [Solanum lycopersicum]|uniref:putative F-box/kelch-repeat protein At1g20790 n=1 Tax=Solanum lycopersicum TaxID=4081 RepID=UPI0008FEC191|nr:F-box protein At5g07610-like isoform X1 [Solanum lycopersicum]